MIATVSARAFARDLAGAKRAAAKGPVFITHRGKPTYAMLTIEDYHRLANGGREMSLLELMDSMPRVEGVDFDIPKINLELKPFELDDAAQPVQSR